ncbi:probable G-protein coupled receptor 25 [Denticeps clupeoides]|uniref:G-protein coupled receptors family 1 profile domain-containing protein n=1 Tax=Denticeps clupeoides TaxID=299321 RepID=A0AAY4BN60_9TELE|nr:probable G-protein coupled receptor 25 [Denticeps clupeoides]
MEGSNLAFDYDYYNISDLNNSFYHDILQEDEIPTNRTLSILYFIIFFTGFSGNIFVILVMCNRRKKSARLVDTFVVNLAVADLVFVLTLPLWAVSTGNNHRWDFGDALCRISSYIISVNRFSNIFFLTCMSMDRYLAIVRLLDSQFLRTSRCVQITCLLVWLVSLVLGVPALIFRSVDGDSMCVDNMNSPFFQNYTVFIILVSFVLPMPVIMFCYGSIVSSMHRHCTTTIGNTRTQARHRHSLKIVFSIITAFLVSWLPFNLFKTIQVITKMSKSNQIMDFLEPGLVMSSCLAFLNSCMNPVIYVLLDKHFRKRAAYLCIMCLGQSKEFEGYNTSTSLSSKNMENHNGSTGTRGRLLSLK